MWRICLPESMEKEVWSLCHQSDIGGHRGLKGTLNKFLKGFFLLSARQKPRFLNGRCDTCFSKERSMPGQDRKTCSILNRVCWRQAVYRVNLHGYHERKLNLLTAEDSCSRYCRAYPILNKEAHTVAKVLMDKHFNVYGLLD